MFQIKSIIADRPGVVIGTASVLLGIILLLHAATLWWPTKPEAQKTNSGGSRALEFDIDRIVSSQVFSSSNSEVADAKLSATETETLVSHSEFSLQAIFESSDANRSTVIIAKSGQAPRSYSVGAALADGITISRIERDRVYLSNHGQSAVLRFKQQSRMPASTIQRAADKLLGQMSEEGKLGQVKQRLEQLRRQSQEQ